MATPSGLFRAFHRGTIGQLDQVVRQRSLYSLDLFLSCAQKQLSALLKEESTTTEENTETEIFSTPDTV